MGLEAVHKSIDEIPEEFRSLYSERNGQFELTGINGVKTQADVDRLTVGISKEREATAEVKAKLKPWNELGVEFDDVVSKLDKFPELEAAVADGGIDEEKMGKLVEARLTTRLAPIERENAQLKAAVEERDGVISEYKSKDVKRTVQDALRPALVELKVLDTAHEDALMLGERLFEVREDDGAVVMRDQVGYTPGITPKDWLGEIQAKRPHWWAPSQGGGAGGGSNNFGVNGGKNPWSKENWNITQQGQVVKEHGIEKATEFAKQAGSAIGSIHPPAK